MSPSRFATSSDPIVACPRPQRHRDHVLDAGGAHGGTKVSGRVELGADRHGVLPRDHAVPDAAGVRRDVQQPGIADASTEQELRVAALAGQPKRRVLASHEHADPAEQHVRQATVGALLMDRERQLVDIGEVRCWRKKLHERTQHQAERDDQQGQRDGRPRCRSQADQEDEAMAMLIPAVARLESPDRIVSWPACQPLHRGDHTSEGKEAEQRAGP